jgi:hypothetical protein
VKPDLPYNDGWLVQELDEVVLYLVDPKFMGLVAGGTINKR